MKRHVAALFLLPLLTGGCSIFTLQPEAPSPHAELPDPARRADELRGEALMLRYSGRYVEALARLNEATDLQPNDRDLAAERRQTERIWQQLREQLQDRIRVTEATEQIERLPLLERLVRADPSDNELQARLLTLRHEMQINAGELSACGRRQAEMARELAQSCLRLALAVRPDHRDRALLSKLEPNTQPRREKKTPKIVPSPSSGSTPSKTEKTFPASKTAPALPLPELIKAWKIKPPPVKPSEKPTMSEELDAPPQPELREAWQLMQRGNYFGAVQYLGNLKKNGQDTDESRRLLAQAEAMLAENTRSLLEAGDLLYRQGLVKEALALWDAALSVDPYNMDARRKSERAARVLSNLEALDEEKATDAPP